MDMLTFLGFGGGNGEPGAIWTMILRRYVFWEHLVLFLSNVANGIWKEKLCFMDYCPWPHPMLSQHVEHVATQTLLSTHFHTPCRTV